jgi:hypothetical protein
MGKRQGSRRQQDGVGAGRSLFFGSLGLGVCRMGFGHGRDGKGI